MLEQFFEFYTTLYQLSGERISVKPAGWVIAGVLAIGCGLLYYCSRYSSRPRPFLFWLGAILLSIPLAFLEIGAIVVTACWIIQESAFQLEPYFLTLPLMLASFANLALLFTVFPAIFRNVEGGKPPIKKRKETARVIEIKAVIGGILFFVAAIVCSILVE